MPHDARKYAVITHDFADSPKLQILPVEARWALLEMILYSARMRTDGRLSKRLANARWGLDVCQVLLENDPANPSLKDSGEDYVIHDFLEHQTAKSDIESLSDKRRAAGRKGGKAKARVQKDAGKQTSSKRLANAKANAKQMLWQNASKPLAEEEEEGGEVSDLLDAKRAETNTIESTPSDDFPGGLDDEIGAAIAAAFPQQPDETTERGGVFGTPDDPRCAKHKDLPRDQVPACAGCARAREHFQAEAQARREAKRHAIEQCSFCDERGFVTIGQEANTTLAKCDHITPPERHTPPEAGFKPQSDPEYRERLLNGLKRRTERTERPDPF